MKYDIEVWEKETVWVNRIYTVEVEKEIKSVPSDYRKGVVIKIPYEFKNNESANPIKIGDIIIYKEGTGRWFDLCKDTQLIDMYAIIGVEK